MKYFKNIMKNYYSIKYYFFLILLLDIFSFSLTSILIGEYPYIKRLLNGNYIILSDTSISFTDGALQTQFNIIHLNNIYGGPNNENKIASTTVSQFKESDDGYIIAILNQELFIFSSSGIYQVNTTISSIDPTNVCSIIPNKKDNNNYYFTVINTQCINNDNNCNYLLFHKGIFNSNSKTINFEEEVSFDLTSHLGSGSNIYGTISCDLMNNKSQEIIVCFYGEYNYFAISSFDTDTYTEISFQIQNDGGQYFKSIVLPEEREKAIICRYKYDD
jgi:hypothetical protein